MAAIPLVIVTAESVCADIVRQIAGPPGGTGLPANPRRGGGVVEGRAERQTFVQPRDLITLPERRF